MLSNYTSFLYSVLDDFTAEIPIIAAAKTVTITSFLINLSKLLLGNFYDSMFVIVSIVLGRKKPEYVAILAGGSTRKNNELTIKCIVTLSLESSLEFIP